MNRMLVFLLITSFLFATTSCNEYVKSENIETQPTEVIVKEIDSTEEGYLPIVSNDITNVPTATTTPAVTFSPVNVVAVDAFFGLSAAVTDTGDLFTWGTDNAIPVKIMSDVKTVSIGREFYMALTSNGDVYTWGINTYGQLGNGEFGSIEPNPVKILDNIAYIDAGGYHALAVTNNGELYVWGLGKSGEIGNGIQENQITPVKIMDGVMTASAGAFITAAITENGELYVWGYNTYGAVGNGEYRTEDNVFETTPQKIMSDVALVSTSINCTAAVTTDGSLYTWGNNEVGLLGNGIQSDGDFDSLDTIVPKPQKIMDGIVSVSINNYIALAIDTEQNLLIWGKTEFGQLGDGIIGDGNLRTNEMFTTTPTIAMEGVKYAATCTLWQSTAKVSYLHGVIMTVEESGMARWAISRHR